MSRRRRTVYERLNARDRARRRGTDAADHVVPIVAPLLRRQRPIYPQASKSELREICSAALDEWKTKQETVALAAEPRRPQAAKPVPADEPASAGPASGLPNASAPANLSRELA